ncbi:unnamed protein product [Arctia plantaginis]|uniref:Uncharacterized protein n=1 Tax=Arctia plantaginis TaxID=874455 RepID=A0A8S0ZQC5_ARCPL|nr:unnamed protein product [Arctia plantaginis]
MAKAAMDQFTKLIALELAPHGVRVNTVSPGITVSKFVTRLTNFTEEEYANWLEKISLGIPMGEPCLGLDIAKMIVHLASDNSKLVTGTIVDVDGGYKFTMSGISVTD